MAPEVIACDENPDATYDYRVRESCSQKKPKPQRTSNIYLQYERPWMMAVFETSCAL